jgi:hypothetical protein
MNRTIDALIASGGFSITQIERDYGPGPKPLSYLYKEVAVPRRRPPVEERQART